MDDSPEGTVPTRRRRPFLIGSAVVAALTLVAAAAVWVVLGGLPYEPPRMSDTFTGLEGVTTVAEKTSELCAATPCVEAWETGVGTYLRFADADLAESWSIIIGGDSHRNGSVVLDMNGLTLTRDQRQLAVELLFPGRESS